MKSANFVQSKFREYYAGAFSLNGSLPSIEKREFGFASFEGWMLRHKSFRARDELDLFLRDSVPKDAYVSCAYYGFPEEEMDKKNWLGADLIFDIDADHLVTPCGKVHDDWTCGVCGYTGKGVEPEKCPVCNSEKFEVNTWLCETCLESAKKETIKLLEILMGDFGFLDKEIRLFFSGHRGYHVHILNSTIETLDSAARKEIVDYITGLGLCATSFESRVKGREGVWASEMLGSSNLGWSKRIAQGVHRFFLEATVDDYVAAGLTGNIIRAIVKNRDGILEKWNNTGDLGPAKGIGPQTWDRIVKHCASLQSARIDTVVTTDIHRLIRLPSTLHGKTGLLKVEFSVLDIKEFDPFVDAVAFKNGNALVLVSSSPEFRLANKKFGPYKSEKVELPTAAALLLICKGRAEVLAKNVQ